LTRKKSSIPPAGIAVAFNGKRAKQQKLYGGTMHKPKRVRVNYRLRPDIKESVEQIATETGKTMTEVVEDAVKLYVESIATNPAE